MSAVEQLGGAIDQVTALLQWMKEDGETTIQCKDAARLRSELRYAMAPPSATTAQMPITPSSQATGQTSQGNKTQAMPQKAPTERTQAIELPTKRTKPIVPLFQSRAAYQANEKEIEIMLIAAEVSFSDERGRLLDKILGAIGFKRCYDAKPMSEVEPNRIKPVAVLSLGEESTRHILGDDLKFIHLVGMWQPVNNTHVMPLFDMAYMIENKSAKERTWLDLKWMMNHLGLELPSKP